MPEKTAGPLRLLRIAVMLVAMGALALPAFAEVYKCVSANGHVTYQQSPCARDQRGTTVNLEDAVAVPSTGDDAKWSMTAREGRVVVGMPKTFVTAAWGRPGEIRAAREDETGSEVWIYPKPGLTTRVGFKNNAVAWIRSDASRPAAASGTSPPTTEERERQVREALVVGKACAVVLQETGTPDREEPLLAGTMTGTRYVYEFDAVNANAYAAFVCLGGRVTSVERYTPERRSDAGSGPPPKTPSMR